MKKKIMKKKIIKMDFLKDLKVSLLKDSNLNFGMIGIIL